MKTLLDTLLNQLRKERFTALKITPNKIPGNFDRRNRYLTALGYLSKCILADIYQKTLIKTSKPKNYYKCVITEL